MDSLIKKVIFLIVFLVFLSFSPKTLAFAPNFLHALDEITNSAPATSTTHIVLFRVNDSIPPLGKIEISFPQEFNIPVSFDYSDVDFATSSARNGVYYQRYLASSSASSTDKVEVVSGNGGKISIILNSSVGLHSGEWVKIILGKQAAFQESGDQEITNPTSTGSFKLYLKSYDNLGNLLNQNEIMVAIVNQVAVTTTVPPDIYPPYRYNGLPSGTVAENTESVSLSLDTDEWAYCRYATSAGLTYASMTAELSSAPSLHHSTVISNLSNGHTYNFYIRCTDTHDNANSDDYLIAFSVKASVPAPPGQGGGIAGGAPYPPPPSSPTVKISGWAYPAAQVNILKDGELEKTITAKQDATFSYTFTSLKQGVYTFGVWAQDSENRKSITDSTTLSVRAGTTNLVSSFIPPTIELSTDVVQKGEDLTIKGQSPPNSSIELWIYASPKEGQKILESNLIKVKTTSSPDGKWEVIFKTDFLSQKTTYEVKARATFNAKTSDFSKILYFGVGTKPKISFALKADLNKDSKVNLVDFSILLFYWGKSESLADINSDGVVNLADFSIMMYYWTG